MADHTIIAVQMAIPNMPNFSPCESSKRTRKLPLFRLVFIVSSPYWLRRVGELVISFFLITG